MVMFAEQRVEVLTTVSVTNGNGMLLVGCSAGDASWIGEIGVGNVVNGLVASLCLDRNTCDGSLRVRCDIMLDHTQEWAMLWK